MLNGRGFCYTGLISYLMLTDKLIVLTSKTAVLFGISFHIQVAWRSKVANWEFHCSKEGKEVKATLNFEENALPLSA